ncbi:hypothetical protein D3C85_1195310 [compost metagenome]
MVTWRSSITSNKADWVLAGARLISSTRIILPKIGPFLNSKSPVLVLKMGVPKTSEGIKSGVNCTRENCAAIDLASNLALSVLATPGTPSIKICPSASKPTIKKSITCFCPIMIFPSTFLIWFTASFNALKSVRGLNCSCSIAMRIFIKLFYAFI